MYKEEKKITEHSYSDDTGDAKAIVEDFNLSLLSSFSSAS